MRIPDGMTEEEVVKTIKTVVKRLSKVFRFGYHSLEDIESQGTIEAINGIEKYDGKRPLENFLWTHVRNRLYNYKRNNYERPDKPCFKCPFSAYDPGLKESDSGCKLHLHLINCDPYSEWYKRNAPKRHLMCTTDIENIDDEREKNMSSDEESFNIDEKNMFEIIDKNLPLSMREDYLKIKFGYKVPKKRSIQIVEKIREILEENGIKTTTE